jgi:hypothetical protein
MSTTGIVITIVVVIAVVVIALAVWNAMRRRRLRDRFGPEYERAVAEQPNRKAAETELRAREERHAQLSIQPISSADRDRYQKEWTRVQAAFVEDPVDAVNAADALVTRMMRARSYPTGDFSEQLDSLSVEHARTLDHYREAHGTYEANLRGEASTEQLRQAFVHYRVLATDLLDVDDAVPDRDRVDHPTTREDTP